MPRFFDNTAHVTYQVPEGTPTPANVTQTTDQPWQMLGPLGLPGRLPLRRSRAGFIEAGNGVVHVNTQTGEYHTHGELQLVDHEPGMTRVRAEDVRPQRPLDQVAYNAFSQELSNRAHSFWVRNHAAPAVSSSLVVNSDVSTIIASYLPMP